MMHNVKQQCCATLEAIALLASLPHRQSIDAPAAAMASSPGPAGQQALLQPFLPAHHVLWVCSQVACTPCRMRS